MPGPSGDVNGTGDFDFKAFFNDIPPVTRTIFMTMFTCTLLSGLGVLPVNLFLLEWYPITSKFQIWRLLFTFFHLGRLGLAFLIRMYFLYTYSQQLEIGTFFGRPANYAWFLTLISAFVIAISTVLNTYINGGAWLIAIIHLWGRHADNVTVTMYGFIQIPAKYLSLTMLVLDVIITGGVSTADGLGLLGGQLYYILDSVYPAMPDGKQLIFVPMWFENFIHQLSQALSSATSLGSGPQMSQSYSTSGRGNRTSTAAGRPQTGATSSGVRSGFTVPSVRGGYTWGRGNTLGSS